MANIESKDIAVVVQGGIDPVNTPNCLLSIRRRFPKALIILSTWEGADVNGLDFDLLVKSKDPGGHTATILRTGSKLPNNLARQIVSTQAGLRYADRHYVLKTRSDLIWRDNAFLQYFGKYKNFNEDYRVFNERIIVTHVTHSYRTKQLFQPMDWVAFGTQGDMKRLYNIPIPKERENTVFFTGRELERKQNLYFNSRYTSEQYIFIQCLRNASYYGFHDATDVNDNLQQDCEKYLANCFIILELGNQINFSFIKYKQYAHCPLYYSHNEWLALYKKYA